MKKCIVAYHIADLSAWSGARDNEKDDAIRRISIGYNLSQKCKEDSNVERQSSYKSKLLMLPNCTYVAMKNSRIESRS